MIVAKIPGLRVSKLDKNRFAVSVTNGNIGAGIVTKEQLYDLAQERGGKVKEIHPGRTLAKIVGFAAATAAAIYFRKDISKFLKTGKVGEFFNKVGEKVSPFMEKVKNSKLGQKAAELLNKFKGSKFVQNADPKVKNIANKVVDFVDTKGKVVENKVTDFASKFSKHA